MMTNSAPSGRASHLNDPDVWNNTLSITGGGVFFAHYIVFLFLSSPRAQHLALEYGDIYVSGHFGSEWHRRGRPLCGGKAWSLFDRTATV